MTASSDAPPVAPELVDFAVGLARDAGKLTTEWFANPDLTVDSKADGTPVTAADRAAERYMRSELAKHHPADGIIGEEEPPTDGSSGRRWIMDPIDGTKPFTRGVPLYSTLLAFDDEHGPAIGVIVLPALNQAVWAGRGRGCWFDGVAGQPRQAAHVSSTTALENCYLCTSCYGPWSDEALLGVKHAGISMRGWGDGYGYALVATGRIDAMVDPAAELYDVAPMPVILSEAGGTFTSVEGDPSPDKGSGVASNGAIHDDLLGLLNP